MAVHQSGRGCNYAIKRSCKEELGLLKQGRQRRVVHSHRRSKISSETLPTLQSGRQTSLDDCLISDTVPTNKAAGPSRPSSQQIRTRLATSVDLAPSLASKSPSSAAVIALSAAENKSVLSTDCLWSSQLAWASRSSASQRASIGSLEWIHGTNLRSLYMHYCAYSSRTSISLFYSMT